MTPPNHDRRRRLRPLLLALAGALVPAAWLISHQGLPAGVAATTALTPSATPAATSTPQPTLTLGPTFTPLPTSTSAASPTPVPTATPSLPSLPPVYYWDGKAVYAVYPNGAFATLVVKLPANSSPAPQLLPDGRLLYAAQGQFATVDRYGRQSGIRPPDLASGECIWTVSPSPDARTLAWQILTTTQPGRCATDPQSVRVALTGRFGDAGVTTARAQFDTAHGQAPVVLGWRPASPYGLGGATLLLQDLYSRFDLGSRILPNTTRGLLEYDPAIGDLVNDYLPPSSSDVPGQRDFAVSSDGVWAVYGDSPGLTPSGEGPLMRRIFALNLNTNSLALLDDVHKYPTSKTVVTVTKQVIADKKHKGKKRTVTHKTSTTLRLYQYVSHRAYVAPDDRRVLYTLLTVSYPPGALTPQVEDTAMVVSIDGRSPGTVVARNAQGEGWLNSTTMVIKKKDGLYAVDAASGRSTRLARGAGVAFIGVR
jgi:hypothetical protein